MNKRGYVGSAILFVLLVAVLGATTYTVVQEQGGGVTGNVVLADKTTTAECRLKNVGPVESGWYGVARLNGIGDGGMNTILGTDSFDNNARIECNFDVTTEIKNDGQCTGNTETLIPLNHTTVSGEYVPQVLISPEKDLCVTPNDNNVNIVGNCVHRGACEATEVEITPVHSACLDTDSDTIADDPICPFQKYIGALGTGNCPTDHICVEGSICCELAICGNGVKENTEACDDGNTLAGDGCSATCDLECPVTIDTPGRHTLPQSVLNCSHSESDGIVITINDVILDCEGKDIIGNYKGSSKSGIKIDSGKTNVSIRNCKATSFGTGISTSTQNSGEFYNNDLVWLTDGMVLTNSDNINISNNDFDSLDGDAITFLSGSELNYVCGGTFTAISGSNVINPTGNPGADDPTAACQDPVCGNNIVEVGEECDDGNADNTDACLDTCVDASCGDGFVLAGTETCDDDNTVAGDGCDATCQEESSWTCAGEPSSCTPDASGTCGDGTIDAGEACDDGNAANNDGCSDTCTFEDDCLVTMSKPDATTSITAGGPLTLEWSGGSGLSSCATLFAFRICPVTGICLLSVATDVNPMTSPATGSTSSVPAGTWIIKAVNKSNINQIYGVSEAFTITASGGGGGTCFDSIQNQDETGIDCGGVCPACSGTPTTPTFVCTDGGNSKFTATSVTISGDGSIQTFTNTCADSSTVTNYKCSSTGPDPYSSISTAVSGMRTSEPLTCDTGTTCVSGACSSNCGNSVVDTGEECDDLDAVNGADCSSCAWLPDTDHCGDGTIQAPNGDGQTETCDDDNIVSGDGCSSTCTLETGYKCPTEGSACILKCGDGVVDSGETCDDGNTAAGDGCSASCTTEGGYVCPTAGQACDLLCGNKELDGIETCDDGNTVAGDGCDASCQDEDDVATCPNNIVETGEQCDDGASGSANCTVDCLTVYVPGACVPEPGSLDPSERIVSTESGDGVNITDWESQGLSISAEFGDGLKIENVGDMLRLNFTTQITVGGIYRVYIHALGKTTQNQINVSFDTSSPSQSTLVGSNDYAWHEIASAKGFSPGNHTITITPRDVGDDWTIIDGIIITTEDDLQFDPDDIPAGSDLNGDSFDLYLEDAICGNCEKEGAESCDNGEDNGVGGGTDSCNVRCSGPNGGFVYTEFADCLDPEATDFEAEYGDVYNEIINPVLCNEYGKIEIFNNVPLDFTGKNLDANIDILQGRVRISTPTIPVANTPANITLYNIDYVQDPVIFRDSIICTDLKCKEVFFDSDTDTVVVNVTGFSSYIVAANAQLNVTAKDEEEPNRNVFFYIDYTNTTSGDPITNVTDSGACNITFNDTLAANLTNYTTGGQYVFNRTFTELGYVNYTVECNATGYEFLEVSDSILINLTPPALPVIRPLPAIVNESMLDNDYIEIVGYILKDRTVKVINLDDDFLVFDDDETLSELEDTVLANCTTVQTDKAVGSTSVPIQCTPEVLLDGRSIEIPSDYLLENFTRYNITGNSSVFDFYVVNIEPNLQNFTPNGTNVTLHERYKKGGWFTMDVKLKPGMNKLYIFGEDAFNQMGPALIVDVTYELPQNDIVLNITDNANIEYNPAEMNATWTNLSLSSYADTWNGTYMLSIGTAPYPQTGYADLLPWTPIHNNSGADYIHYNLSNFTLDGFAVYYFNIRAYDTFGQLSQVYSTDGIAYIDGTPPDCDAIPGSDNCITDYSDYTNLQNVLQAFWNFTDPQSDIMKYEYAIGTSTTPGSPGFETVVPRTEVDPATDGSYTLYQTGITLVHDTTYYVNVKARNGNLNRLYNGSWSQYNSSNGITADLVAPEDGWLTYNTGILQNGDIDLTYDVGWDNGSGIANASILVGKVPINESFYQQSGNTYNCMTGGFNDGNFSIYVNDYGNPSANTYTADPGYCYAFMLRVYDYAGNLNEYTPAGPAIYAAVDNKAPAKIEGVSDEGFITIRENLLYANWTPSYDNETAIAYYQVQVFGHSPSDPNKVGSCPDFFTNLQTCDENFSANVTTTTILAEFTKVPEITYYFVITPIDRAGNAGIRGISDGITYLDAGAPNVGDITSVNEDTNASDGWFTAEERQVSGGYAVEINFTEESGMTCTVTEEDVDFTLAGEKCTEMPPGDGNYNCTTIVPGQGTFMRHISCRDGTGNIQTWDINTDVEFTVDWPDRVIADFAEIIPINAFDVATLSIGTVKDLVAADEHTFELISVNPDNLSIEINGTLDTYLVSNVSGKNVYELENTSDSFFITDESHNFTGDFVVYAFKTALQKEDVAVCFVNYYDNDDNINWTMYNWTISGTEYSEYGNETISQNLEIIPEAIRGRYLTCEFNATDETNNTANATTTKLISNTMPDAPADAEYIPFTTTFQPLNDTITFNWNAASDVDGDNIIYEIVVHNDSGLIADPTRFNYSNFANMGVNDDLLQVPTGVGSPGNVSVYSDRIAYDTLRTSWDINMYNVKTNVTTQVTNSPRPQQNPRIYGQYIVYEERPIGSLSNVILYTIGQGTKLDVGGTSHNEISPDIYENHVVYSNLNSGIYLYDIDTGKKKLIIPTTSASKVRIHGKNVFWNNGTELYRLDMVNNLTEKIDDLDNDNWDVYGNYIMYVSGGDVTGYDMSKDTLLGTNPFANSLIAISRNTGLSNWPTQLFVSKTVSDYTVVVNGTALISTGIDKVRTAFVNDTILYTSTIQNKYPSNFYSDTNSIDINLSESADGTYYWSVRACDTSGMEFSCNNDWFGGPAEVGTFRADSTGPIVNITYPTNGLVAGNWVSVVADLIDDSIITKWNITIYNITGTPTVLETNETSSILSLTSIQEAYDFSTWDGVTNITIVVSAWDELGNKGSAEVNVTINNDGVLFKHYDDTDLDLLSDILYKEYYNTTLTRGYTVLNTVESGMTITGPTSSDIRYQSANASAYKAAHIYNDSIYIDTWPDGRYELVMTGYNSSDIGGELASWFSYIYVDRKIPEYNLTITQELPDGVVNMTNQLYAGLPFEIEMNISDLTLIDNVTVTYQDPTNRSAWIIETCPIVDTTVNKTATCVFDGTDLHEYWNSTTVQKYNWTIYAKDYVGQILNKTFTYDVVNTPVWTMQTNMTETVDEDTVGQGSMDDIIAEFDKYDNLTFTWTASAANFTVNITNDSNVPKAYYYEIIPDPDFYGQVNFSIEATDVWGSVNSSNFTINYTPVDDAPRALDVPTIYVFAGVSTPFNLSEYLYDVDNDTVTYSVGSGSWTSTQGNLTINETGWLNITPTLGTEGIYTMSFTIDDNITLVESDPVNIHVIPPVYIHDVDVNDTTPLVGPPYEMEVYLNISTRDGITSLEFNLTNGTVTSLNIASFTGLGTLPSGSINQQVTATITVPGPGEFNVSANATDGTNTNAYQENYLFESFNAFLQTINVNP